MTVSTSPDRRITLRFSLAAGTAMAIAGLACATDATLVSSAHAASPEKQLAERAAKADRAVAAAEKAVVKAPQDPAFRVTLGRAYLAAGRFESALTTFSDAVVLGDQSGRTALVLALSAIGANQPRAAVAVLDGHRDDIAAGDLGLALALAGETSRGVAILADAVRSGENSATLRQNLAYAFALDGRWAEAKVVAAQDVPAAQLDRRLAIWALSALPDRNRERLAGLLGAPMRRDPGQPAALALQSDAPAAAARFAQAEPAADSAPAGVSAAAPAPASTAASELPALAAAPEAPASEQPTVAANLAAQAAAAPVAPVTLAKPQPVRSFATVAQAFGAREFQAVKFQPARAHVPARTRAVGGAMARQTLSSTHVVQLGAFSSEKNARRAWGIYTRQNPKLSAYRPVIVPAVVRGKQIWRVAAGGLSGRFAANGLCARLKSRGSACFAYVLPSRTLAAPVAPGHELGGMMRARR